MRSFLLPLMAVLVLASAAQEVHIALNDGWSFCQVGKEEWRSAEVPGVVQTDLLHHQLIPDFMQGSNIDSVQWIENEDWIYKRTLFVADTLLRHGHLDLVFKGLDTFAEVYLNDSLIGKADNMFRTWEWEVKHLLKKGENELKVIFRSPIKEGAKLREAYGIQLPHDNDPTGVSPYIRKAAYQFGWDFCPRLVTSGIWKGVELRGWSLARILNVELLEFPWLYGQVGRMANPVIGSYFEEGRKGVNVKIYINNKKVRKYRHRLIRDENKVKFRPIPSEFNVQWHPQRNGEQHLQRLRVELWRGRSVLSTWEDDIGFNNIVLVTRSDRTGSTFSFQVDGVPRFLRGANVVPPSLTPGPRNDVKWVELVGQAKRAGIDMLRVWSGGIYPPEAFYDACDSAGIMVWQDLMFANMTQGLNSYRSTIGDEILGIRSAIQHHPCLVLWCGNNELDVAWENWGWQQRYELHGEDSAKVANDASMIFERAIPRSLRNWNSTRDRVPYTPTSPLSNWGNAKGLTEGDLHYWGVWHGDSTFSSFKNNVGRFVSEWGFQSYPDSALLAKYIHPDSLYLGSPAVARLQRSYKTDRPIWEAIERELGEERPTTLGGFIEASQRAQAKAYGMAIEAHLGAQPHCMGTLLWQLNDCWPGPSWSIIDYEGNPKPAYQVVKRAFNGE